MLATSQKSRAVLMVAHCWRFDEDVLWLRKHAVKLGQIIRTKGYGVHVNWGPAGWFTQKELAGGGAMADMGIHALDTARFLLGDPQPISVYAKIGTYYKDFNVDDTGVILVNWEGEALSYIESGWWQPHADGPEACTQLYGVNGFGQLFPTFILGKSGIRKEAGTPYPRNEHCLQSMYDAQMAYFLKCIRTGATPVPGGAEGLINMQIVDAAYKSARSGKVEKVWT
jgi:predicted dehydrogenase